jgi:serine/threonine protein kinase
MSQAAIPAPVFRSAKGLTHLCAKVKIGRRSAEYSLDEIVGARQRNALLVSYTATREGGQSELPERLVIKLPSREAESKAKSAEVAGVLAQHKKILNEQLFKVDSVPRLYQGSVQVQRKNLGSKYSLIREYVPGLTLHEWMGRYAIRHGVGQFQGLEDIDEWFRFARAMAGALEKIHRRRVLHGDLRPENIIVDDAAGTPPKIRFVNVEDDAGNRKALRSVREPGSFRQKYDAPAKLFSKADAQAEAVLGSARVEWFAPPDIFSLGATLFELACGQQANLHTFHKETEVAEAPGWYKVGAFHRLKRDEDLKQQVLKALMARHCPKMACPRRSEGVLKVCEVIMGCVRSQSRNQVADIEGILQILDQFDPPEDDSEQHWATEWRPTSYKFEDAAPPALRAVVNRRVRLLDRELGEVGLGGPLRVLGDRQTFLDVMITALRALGPEDECRALVTPTFFNSLNMGAFGRLTAALQLAQLRGVSVRWVIAMEEHRIRDQEVANLLEYQKKAGEIAASFGKRDYGIKYVALSSEDYSMLGRDKLMYVDMGPRSDTGPRLMIAPDYREGEAIAVLRLWAVPQRVPESFSFRKYVTAQKTFEEYWAVATPIRSFHR